MNERLKAIRKALNLKQDDIGDKIRFSRSHVSSLENGTRELTDRIINDICREFNVNEDWLRYGTGEMFVQSETFSLDEKAQKNNLTELEIDIMRGYMDLPATTRKELMTLFGSIYGRHAETAATTVVDPIEAELESYRRELEAEKKGATLLTSEELHGESG